MTTGSQSLSVATTLPPGYLGHSAQPTLGTRGVGGIFDEDLADILCMRVVSHITVVHPKSP